VHADEDVGQIGNRVDAVLFAGGHERIHDGEIAARFFVADEEEVLATERDATKGRFGDVVVGRDGRVMEEAADGAAVSKEIADSAAHLAARLEVVSQGACPSKQSREKRTRVALAELEMLVGPDNPRVFGLPFDAIDVADDVERDGGFRVLVGLEDLSSCVSETTRARALSRCSDGVVAGAQHTDRARAHRARAP
jgi:hypothetical protein